MDGMEVAQMRLMSKSYRTITYFILLDEGISTGIYPVIGLQSA